MIRVLVIIAVTGFLVSVVCISAAVGIAGPDAIARGDWAWDPGDGWNFNFGQGGWFVHRRHDSHDGGPSVTREIAWTGGDSIDLDLPADVRYTQAAGPAKLVVTGPRDAVADVEVEDGHVGFNHDHHHGADLMIVMTAPSVTRFDMNGSGKLAIAGYKQDQLTLDLSGDADVDVKGETKAVDLSISGSANADLGELKAKSAQVNIEGSGDATVAPTDLAKIDISGSGDVTLLTNPPKLETSISGSGGVRHDERGPATPAPSPAPSRSLPKSGART